MSKGIAALSYLPAIDIVIDATAGGSVETMKGLAMLIAKFQKDEIADGAYPNSKGGSVTPYHEVDADVTVSASGATIEAILNASPDTRELSSLDALGRAALSTRRLITVALASTGNTFTVRSLVAVLNFIAKLEDRVAQKDDPAEGDGTYTDISVKGHSPYESFVWTVVKLGADYVLTSTAGS